MTPTVPLMQRLDDGKSRSHNCNARFSSFIKQSFHTHLRWITLFLDFGKQAFAVFQQQFFPDVDFEPASVSDRPAADTIIDLLKMKQVNKLQVLHLHQKLRANIQNPCHGKIIVLGRRRREP
ncbi:hypothetical protein JTE90_026934 [Oedothorax gibbosus]|uniref:Uncharacterized protein n=1 Tax=Oedothorax gibbosus TaxID=931172 RepID=A0AAV6TV77_9ARAC|nr:hypothetical protein JTE90_026934 [Oedothorax gibbosus]